MEKIPVRAFQKMILFLLLCVGASCGTSTSRGVYQIGIDPSWYGVELLGKEKAVLGFSTDLLKLVGEEKDLRIELVTTNWDVLLASLQNKQCQAILSPMSPYSFNITTYDFSDIYLETGPVLVTSMASPWDSLSQLDGKEIAVIGSVQDELLLETNAKILIRHYLSIPQALNDIVAGVIDGALINVLIASSYVQDLYKNQLKIATAPLKKEGLRLVTLHNSEPALIADFNATLSSLQASGKYLELQKKWSLTD